MADFGLDAQPGDAGGLHQRSGAGHPALTPTRAYQPATTRTSCAPAPAARCCWSRQAGPGLEPGGEGAAGVGPAHPEAVCLL